MTDRPMMKCGCVAMSVCSSRGGVKYDPPIPSCITHDCFEVAEGPDLSGRTAQCSYFPKGHAPKPSSLDLAFFVFKGDGSMESKERCVCGYYEIAHKKRPLKELKCSGFRPHGPFEFDEYYCGCHGWD